MEDKLIIDVKTFVEMFVSISYLQEQRMFNSENIRVYIRKNHGANLDDYDFYYYQLFNELDSTIDDMTEKGIISKIDGNLYFITDKINYKEIINNNHHALADMTEVFYNIYGGKDKKVSLVTSNSSKKNTR